MLHGAMSAGPAGEPGVASMDIPVKFHYFEVTKMTI